MFIEYCITLILHSTGRGKGMKSNISKHRPRRMRLPPNEDQMGFGFWFELGFGFELGLGLGFELGLGLGDLNVSDGVLVRVIEYLWDLL